MIRIPARPRPPASAVTRAVLGAALLATALACVPSRPVAPPEFLKNAAELRQVPGPAASGVVIFGAGGHLMGDSFCNGVVIARRLVLTAGHCLRSIGRPYFVYAFNYWEQQVTEGEDPEPTYRGPDGFEVKRFVFHPQFDRDFSERAHPHDLAMLELTGDLPAWTVPAKIADHLFRYDTSGAKVPAQKSQREAWERMTSPDRRLLLLTYPPFGAYRGLITFLTTIPMSYATSRQDATAIRVLPPRAGMIIRGMSGSGIFDVAGSSVTLTGILSSATFDSDAVQDGFATSLPPYEHWIKATMAALAAP